MRLTPPHRLVPGVLTLLLVVAFPARTLVAGPKEPPSLTAKAPPPAAPEAGKQFAQAVSPTAGDLSAAAMVDLAGEYGWNEDSDTERKWLDAAVSLPPSPDVGRATVLLSEVTLFAGDRLKAAGRCSIRCAPGIRTPRLLLSPTSCRPWLN